MPVLSKIASPTLADDYDLPSEYPQNWFSSPRTAGTHRHVAFEDDSPPHRHSGTIPTHTRNARLSGFVSNAHSHSNPLSSQQSRSHISISSDDHIPETSERILLQEQNTELRMEIQRLRGRVEAMSYEPVIPIIFVC